MSKLKAVIFDMDGVLVDSEPWHYKIEKILYKKLGIDVPEEVHLTYLGTAGDFMYGDLKARYNLNKSVEELLIWDDEYRIKYFDEIKELAANQGIEKLLQELKGNGIGTAVATSSTPGIVDVLLKKCNLSSYFDHIVTTEHAGKSKPEPDVYILAAQKLGVKSDDCVVIEDSKNGIKAAKGAKMFCVSYQPEKEIDSSVWGADYSIKDFSELNYSTLQKIID
jgi:HAD superfamily hydrolase (TIGR01509 family)